MNVNVAVAVVVAEDIADLDEMIGSNEIIAVTSEENLVFKRLRLIRNVQP